MAATETSPSNEETSATAEPIGVSSEEPGIISGSPVVVSPAHQPSSVPSGPVPSDPVPSDPVPTSSVPTSSVPGKPAADDWLATHFVAVLMILASLTMVLWNLQDASRTNANTGSRYATIEALVDFGTYYIDDTHYAHTIDKMMVGDHYISSKPPLLPTYGAAIYWTYQKLTGQNIGDHEGNVVRTVGFFTGLLFHGVFLVYLYRFSLLLFKRRLTILVTLAVGCFGFLGAAYATTINNHSIGAALGLVGLFHAYRAGTGSPGYKDWVLAGFWFGVDGAVDLTSLAFLPAVGLYLLAKDWRKAVFGFGAAALPGLLALGILNYEITGSIKPAYSNSELKDFPDNYFRNHRSGIDALREPKHIYAWNVLLGHHGVFSMTPVFCFGLYELFRRLKTRSFVRETLVVSAVLGAVFYFYIFKTRNYGGWCVGMRWLVPFMPLLLLYFGAWFDRVKLTRWTLSAVAVAFAIGCFHVQDGLTSPFQFSVWHNWLDGAPNRARVGKTFNLSKKAKTKSKRKRTPVVKPIEQ